MAIERTLLGKVLAQIISIKEERFVPRRIHFNPADYYWLVQQERHDRLVLDNITGDIATFLDLPLVWDPEIPRHKPVVMSSKEDGPFYEPSRFLPPAPEMIVFDVSP